MIRSKLAAPVVGVALLASAAMPMVRAFAAEPAMQPATGQSAGQQSAAPRSAGQTTPLIKSDPAENQQMTGAAMPKADATAGDATENRQEIAATGSEATDPNAPDPSRTGQSQGSSQNFLPFELSRDAAFGLREVQIASRALAAGDKDTARQLIGDAQKRFGAAEAQAITLDQLPSKEGQSVENGSFFPVGAQLMVSEAMSSSPQKQQAMQEAGQQMASGDHTGAHETLRVNEIDVATIVALLPRDETMKALDGALAKLDGDPQAAAQQLAGIERGVIVEGVGLRATPDDTGMPGTDVSGTDATTTGSIAPNATDGMATVGTPDTTEDVQ